MKRKMRTILLATWKNSFSTVLIFSLIVFLASALLSTSLFFTGGDSIEKSIAASMPLELHYTNDNSFSEGDPDGAGNELCTCDFELYQKSMETYMDDLDTLLHDPSLSYGNYNLIVSLPVSTSGGSTFVYGISSKDFFKEHFLTVTDGSLNDLNAESVFLPDDYRKSGYTPGDSYTFYLPVNSGQEMKKLTIAGFYTQPVQYNSTDSFANHSVPLIYNSTVRNILSRAPALYGQQISPTDPMESISASLYTREDGSIDQESLDAAINEFEAEWVAEHPNASQPRALISNISFKMNTLEDYNVFNKKFDAFSMDENRKMAQVEYQANGTERSFSLGLKSSVNHFGAFLTSIGRIKMLYQFIFTAIWILIILSLFQFMRYMQNKRERDLFIQRALGAGRHRIVRFWISYYLWPSLPSILLGCIPGYLFSWLLSRYVGRGSEQMQAEMAQLTSTVMKDYRAVGLFDLSAGRFFINLLLVLLVSLTAVMLCTSITTRMTMHGKLSRHARGEMNYE